jgi:hypothetical protein
MPAAHALKFASHPTRLLAKVQVPYAHDWGTKEFFKAFFVGTRLGTALATMNHAKVAPKGFKPQE